MRGDPYHFDGGEYRAARQRHEARLRESGVCPPEHLSWFRDGVAFTHSYSGVCALMANAHADPGSALYASSTALHEAGARLLQRAQAEGTARPDLDGEDLFALMSALGWLHDQSAFASRADHLFDVVAGAILTTPLARPGGGI